MTEQIKIYIAKTEQLLSDNSPNTDWSKVSSEMLIRIGFYQHERLIHLIVMSLFAFLTVFLFYASFTVNYFIPLAILFLFLTIPYVSHYHFLENSTQKLYKLYYTVLEKAEKE